MKSIRNTLLLFILIFFFPSTWGQGTRNSLKVDNETFEILKQVKASNLADGEILLSLTTHQDLGWIDEIEKCVVMRDTQWITPFLGRLDTDPGFEMDIEQSSIIQEYIIRHPEKKSEISKHLREGRMLIGATYTQPYEEMYYSESLARQFYLGKLWLKNEFEGYNSTSYYNSDVPGRSLQMPQLLAKSGVKNMFISRHERGVFDWYSPDGSSVTTYSPGHYIDFYNILGKENEDAIKALASQALVWTDGYNDIDGKPAVMPAVLNFEFIWDPKPVENLDPFIHLWNNLDEVENGAGEVLKVDLPQIRFSTLDKFFTQIRASSKDIPSISGERPNVWIYIHGPSHHQALEFSRRADILLPAAEKFALAESMISGSFSKYPEKSLNAAWESKIYPDHGWGGKGGQNTDDIFKMSYADALEKAKRILQSSLSALASNVDTKESKGVPIVVFNSNGWQNTAPVEFSMTFDPGTARSVELVTNDGLEIPVQMEECVLDADGFLQSAEFSFIAKDVPSIGFDTYYARLSKEQKVIKTDSFAPNFENQYYIAVFGNGGLESLIDKESDLELLETSFFRAGEVFTMRSEGNGAGEFDAVQQPDMEGFDKTGNHETKWIIESDGPVYRSYRMRQPIRNAVVELQIKFYHQLKKIDFNASLNNWDGTMFREYRMAFPMNMKNGQVSYEVPYGVVEVGKDEMEGAAGERYTVPCNELHPRGIENWISASSDDFGFTLASSVVGVDYIDPTDKQPDHTIIQPILLASRRSCHWEGNDYHQTGNHNYSFSITSHKPGWQHGARFGRASNEKLYVVVNPKKFAVAELDESESFLSVREENIIITAMKKAENENAVAIRYYNSEDKETEVELELWKSFNKAYSTNLIEEIAHEVPLDNKTLRLKTGKRSIETIKLK